MTWPRVLSYPPRHHYVDRLHGRTARLVHRGEDLSRLLDPTWVSDHATDFDVAHLHLARFDPGQQAPTTEHLSAVVQAHRRAGVPVVVTVHDLARPTWPQEDLQLSGLLQAINDDVAAVLTLTRGCADRLESLLDRPVRVIPYGPLLEATMRHRLRTRRRLMEPDDAPVLLHAGRLESRLALEETVAAVRASIRTRLRILVDRDAAATVHGIVGDDARIDVDILDQPDIPALARSMAAARAVLLPYRWATHSATLELATDVGVPVIATDVGHLAEQQPVIDVPCPDGRLDTVALTAVLDGYIDPRPAVREVDRERDLHALECHHGRLYTQLGLGRVQLEPVPDVLDVPRPLVVHLDRDRMAVGAREMTSRN